MVHEDQVRCEPDLRNTMAGWSFAKEQLASALSGASMLNPSLDLSNPCNLNCPYCFIEEKNSARKIRKPDELSVAELLAAVDDFKEAGARTVNLVGAGEPTIDPAFQEVVGRISSNGMITVLFTNGIRLAYDQSLVDFLYEHRVTVVLKYNAISEEVQDLVAGRPGYSKKRNQALENLQDRGFNAHEPTRLGLDIMAFKGNLNEIPEIHRLCRSRSILPIVGDFIPTGRTESGHFVGYESVRTMAAPERLRVPDVLQPLSAQERFDLFERLRQIDREEFDIDRGPSAAYYGGGICTQILGVYLDIQGDIWPCVARAQLWEGRLLPQRLGNVRQGDRSSSVWRTHPYMMLVRDKYDGGCPYKSPLVSAPPLVGLAGGEPERPSSSAETPSV